MSTTEETREGFYLNEDGEWIPEGWQGYTISELLHFENHRRVPLSAAQRKDRKGQFPYYGASGIFDYLDEYIFSGLHLLISEDGENLVSRKQPIAFKADGQFWVNNHAHILSSQSPHRIYLFEKYISQLDISPYVTGAAQPKLSKGSLERIPFILPSLEAEQKAIAAVLGSLDDKIELLREQNETLEALAQTLFKRWFIDFNFPDENGNPYKDSGGKMTASEFGEIPEGWKITELKKLLVHRKQAVSSESISDNVKYVGLEHIPRKHLQLTEHGLGKDVSSNKSRFLKSDILFGKLRPYFHKVCLAPFDGICSTDILVLNVDQKLWYSFALMHVYSDRLIDFVTLASTGTRMPRTSFGDICRYKIVLPPEPLAESFNLACIKLFEKGSSNTEQIEVLTQLRDTLLPKLMKGEIRVPL